VDKSRYSIVITINKKDMAVKKATKKVVKKSAAKKPAVKKAVKKPATKKAVSMAKVSGFKHKRVILEAVGTESLPDMVLVSAGPSWAKPIVGKRYVDTTRAISAIEALDAEKVIAKGAKSILKEMDAAGIVPMDVENI
jgi:hypothetical protein